MPDISMIQLVCSELEISFNEFLSGERLNSEEFLAQAEQNVVSALTYSDGFCRKSDAVHFKHIIGCRS